MVHVAVDKKRPSQLKAMQYVISTLTPRPAFRMPLHLWRLCMRQGPAASPSSNELAWPVCMQNMAPSGPKLLADGAHYRGQEKTQPT